MPTTLIAEAGALWRTIRWVGMKCSARTAPRGALSEVPPGLGARGRAMSRDDIRRFALGEYELIDAVAETP